MRQPSSFAAPCGLREGGLAPYTASVKASHNNGNNQNHNNNKHTNSINNNNSNDNNNKLPKLLRAVPAHPLSRSKREAITTRTRAWKPLLRCNNPLLHQTNIYLSDFGNPGPDPIVCLWVLTSA